MATTEHSINDALAEVLRETRRAWREQDMVRSENTGLIKGSSKQPDLLIIEPNVAPVVIETEVLPANLAEADARQRLGEKLSSTGRTLWSAIAVRLPERFRQSSGSALRQSLATASDLEMVLLTGNSAVDFSRWPQKGWLIGSPADLSVLAQSAALPPKVIDEAADRLVSGVSEAAAILNDIGIAHPGVTAKISEELRQEDGEQTRRMATTILTNAFVFHGSVARGPGDLAKIQTLSELEGQRGGLSQSAILNEWRIILKVNYWPIFDIARRIFEVIPPSRSQEFINCLASTAESLMESGLMRSHDLTGAVFQKLIADRQFLAAHYTTPAAAALLVGLAVESGTTPARGSWGTPKEVETLRIGDLACGTGTLLSTAYQRIGQLHEMAGGDAQALHASMMANALVGCDVLPSATHLTASALAGAHPSVKCEDTLILTAGYGRQPDGGVALGSLELMDEQRRFPMIAITARLATGTGETEEELWTKLQHFSFHLILMNPPFIRATDHSGHKGVPIPMFAAFSSSRDEQREMSNATRCLFRGTAAHGNAGEASYFLVLADKKLKPRGTIGLVMPLSLISGDSWEECRLLLRHTYSDLILVSIAGASDEECSFSADTGMGECLVIGVKEAKRTKRATFVVLKERPKLPMTGANAAEQIRRAIATKSLRRLEDGPVGGSPIKFGDDLIGYAIEAPLPTEGPWNLARTWDMSLAQAAYEIANNQRIWLPGMPESSATRIPITKVSTIGRVGPVHRDINEDTPTSAGGFRGPFEIRPVQPGTSSTYPTLWAHDAERERCMQFEAESEGVVRQGTTNKGDAEIRDKAARIWGTASHCHFNADFRFNSQSTAMQFANRLTIGGGAWPSISLDNPDQEKALVAWGNTSVGILLHWWHANKQQTGRGRIGVSPLKTLPTLNVAALLPEQLQRAVRIFDDMKARELRPVHEIAVDTTRIELDERFATELLGMPIDFASVDGPLGLLRSKLASEPSIKGAKSIYGEAHHA